MIKTSALLVFLLLLSGCVTLEGSTNRQNIALDSEEVSELASEIDAACSSLTGYRCYADQFAELADKYGQHLSFEVLAKLQVIAPETRACHLIAHGIGWGIYNNSQEPISAKIASAEPNCGSGVQMGLIEAHVKAIGYDELTPNVVKAMCSSTNDVACNHAIGHMSLVATNGEMAPAHEICELFDNSHERISCLAGNFMEYMLVPHLAANGIVPQSRRNWPPLLREFQDFCNEYELPIEQDRALACWRELTHVAFEHFNREAEKILQFCSAAPTGVIQNVCRRHALVELVSTGVVDAENLNQVCSVEVDNDPQFENDCYVEYVGIAINFFPAREPEFLNSICASLDGVTAERCVTALGNRRPPRINAPLNCAAVSSRSIPSCTERVEASLSNPRPENTDSSADILANSVTSICGEGDHPRGKMRCYADEFSEISKRYGEEQAFAILGLAQEIDPSTRGCHFIAHGIGWGLYERNPANWYSLVRSAVPNCAYGAQMGLIERHMSSIPQGTVSYSNVSEFCGNDQPTADCSHAVGHGLLVNAGNDLERAKALCGALPHDAGHRYECLSGVFMERFFGLNLERAGFRDASKRYSTLASRERLCSEQTHLSLEACWKNIAHLLVQVFPNQEQEMFAYCERANDFRATRRCRSHVLGEMSSRAGFNPFQVSHLCDYSGSDGDDWKDRCYSSLVSNAISALPSTSAEMVISFCESLDTDRTSACFQTIGAALTRLRISRPDRVQYCQNAPVQFKQHCTAVS